MLRLIGPAILAYFLATTDIGSIISNLRGLRWAPFLLSLALYPLLVALKAWRWNLVLSDLGLEAPPLSHSIRLYMIGMFLSGTTPGQSGDFVKAWYLRDRGLPLAASLFSVLVDRLLDFLVMALLSLVGLVAFVHLFPPQARGAIEIATIGFAVAIALVTSALMDRRSRNWLMSRAVRLVLGKMGGRIERWRNQFATLDIRPGLVAGLFAGTLCATTVTMVRLWLLFQAMEAPIPLVALVTSMALISNLQSLPISFSGVGVRDAVLIPVLAHYGYGAEKALALSALVLLLNIENILLGYLVSLRHPLGPGTSANPTTLLSRPDSGLT